jgi:hypothetical protein
VSAGHGDGGVYRCIGDAGEWLRRGTGDALSAGRTRTEPLSLRRRVGDAGMRLGNGIGCAVSAGAGHGRSGPPRRARHGGTGIRRRRRYGEIDLRCQSGMARVSCGIGCDHSVAPNP